MIVRWGDRRQEHKSQRGPNQSIVHVLIALLSLPGVTLLRAQEETAGATTSPPQRLSVAVLWLQDRTADPNLAHWRYGSNLLKGWLGNVKAIRIFSKGAVDYAYRQVGLQAGDPVDPNTACRMGEMIEAQRVIWGNYARQNEQWHVELRVLNVARGDLSPALAAASDDWFRVRDELGEQVLQELRVTPTSAEKDKMARRWTHSPEALDWCFHLYLSQEQGKPISEMETLSRKAVGADPNASHTHTLLATTFANQGKFEAAENAVQRALQLDPEASSAHSILGWMSLTQKQLDRAEAEFRRACQLDPDDDDSLMWLAIACGENGKREEATRLMEKVVSLDHTNAQAHAYLANAYAARRRQAEALRELEEARHYLLTGFSAGDTHLLMGDTYRSLGRYPDAIESYERALAAAKSLNINPIIVRQIEQRSQGVKSTLAPTFIQASTPTRYTGPELDRILRAALNEDERPFAANPFSCTDAMRQWAREITHGADTDLDKTRALFGELSARLDSPGRLKSRTAQAVFDAWKDPRIRLVCMDQAVLFVALARAAGLDAFFVHVTRMPDGKVKNHACAAVFLGDRALLVDPAQDWLGIPHRQYAVLDDLQTAAFLCFNNRDDDDPSKLAAYRAGLKLWPESLQGRVFLAGALWRADQAPEAQRVFAEIAPPRSEDWEAALYLSVAANAEKAEQNWERAQEHLLKSLSIDPDQSDAHFNLGIIYVRQHRLAEARTEFRACLRNEPGEHAAKIARAAIAQINEEIGVDAGSDSVTPAPKTQ